MKSLVDRNKTRKIPGERDLPSTQANKPIAGSEEKGAQGKCLEEEKSLTQKGEGKGREWWRRPVSLQSQDMSRYTSER